MDDGSSPFSNPASDFGGTVTPYQGMSEVGPGQWSGYGGASYDSAGLGAGLYGQGPGASGETFGSTDFGAYAGPQGTGYGGYTTGQAQDTASPGYDSGYGSGSGGGWTDRIQQLLSRFGRVLKPIGMSTALGYGAAALGLGPLAIPLGMGLTKEFAPDTYAQMMQMMGRGPTGGVGQPGAGTGGAAGDSASATNPVAAMMNIGSGLYGLHQASGMEARMSPFDQFRAGYGGRLQALERGAPMDISSMPGYKAGLQAVERRMAAQGYTGSGNAMSAIGNFGNDFMQQEMQRLAVLGGAGAAPGAGAIAANQLRGQSLASMAYGLAPFFR